MFSNVGPDHRRVTLQFKLSLRSNESLRVKQIHYDWRVFASDPAKRQQYSVKVQNRFDLQGHNEDEETITEKYKRFLIANEEEKEQLIPAKKKVKGNKI